MKLIFESTKTTGPIKTVVYGPEGIGKSTFANSFPNAIFIDTDDNGSRFLDAQKIKPPVKGWTWETMLNAIKSFARMDISQSSTLVLDTIDKAELLAKKYLLKTRNWKAIDSEGYGTKYVALADEINKLLDALTMVVDSGKSVVVVAHSQRKKQELPDEMGAFDRYELKLERRDAALIKEWADLLLFANYKTTVITTSSNSRKATGGKRVMYTTHKPTWDAKNRLGLPDELPFSFEAIQKAYLEATEKPAKKGNGIPDFIKKLMNDSKITSQDMLDILHKGKFIPANDKLEDVPPTTWQHIADKWQQAINFLNQIKQNNN